VISVEDFLRDGKTIIVYGRSDFRDRRKRVCDYVWIIMIIVMHMGIDAYMR